MIPPYDPDPYRVVDVRGHQITAERRGKSTKRDAQKWKPVRTQEVEAGSSEDDIDDDGEWTAGAAEPPIETGVPGNMEEHREAPPERAAEPVRPRRNPARSRQPPVRLTYN